MLERINKLISYKKDFAFKTSLATKSYRKTISWAITEGYQVTLIFFWLDSVELAIERVRTRVLEGGHNIPEKIIRRRYYSGLKNLFDIYIPICDYWMLFNNSVSPSELIAEGYKDKDMEIKNFSNFTTIKKLAGYDKK